MDYGLRVNGRMDFGSAGNGATGNGMRESGLVVLIKPVNSVMVNPADGNSWGSICAGLIPKKRRSKDGKYEKI